MLGIVSPIVFATAGGELAGSVAPVSHALQFALLAVGAVGASVTMVQSDSADTAVALLGLGLLGYATSTIVVMLAPSWEFMLALGGLAGTAYLLVWIVASGYGVLLWNEPGVSRVTAGLFIVCAPALFGLGVLIQSGVPPLAIEAPLSIAFVALGYELVTQEVPT